MDSIFDMLHGALSNAWLYGATFLLVLGVLVFVHEWGHFIVARLCGVKVDIFSVGFGREVYGWTAKSGTRWKISLFPLGGYVKMFGDSDPSSADFTDEVEENGVVRHMTEEERKGAFFAKPVWQRALIVFAGPAINFLFAIVVLAILYFSIGRPVTPPQISGLEVGGSANLAGFEPHDYIKSVNGTEIDSFREVRRMVILTLEKPMNFVVERDGREVSITATPKRLKDVDRFGFASEYGYMGFVGPGEGINIAAISKVGHVDVAGQVESTRAEILRNLGHPFQITTKVGKKESVLLIDPPAEMNKQLSDPESKDHNAVILGARPGDKVIQYGPIDSIGIATLETWQMSVDTLKAIGEIFTGHRSTKELGGIIRIGAMAGTMAEQGYIALFVFMAGLSINLGLINLFPIPMLDGGHLLFYGMEAARGKPVSERMQEYAFRFGLVILVTLMVFSNLNDILQVFVFNENDT